MQGESSVLRLAAACQAIAMALLAFVGFCRRTIFSYFLFAVMFWYAVMLWYAPNLISLFFRVLLLTLMFTVLHYYCDVMRRVFHLFRTPQMLLMVTVTTSFGFTLQPAVCYARLVP